jgi:hypothetical protein
LFAFAKSLALNASLPGLFACIIMGDTGLACEFENAIVGDTPDMGGCIQLPCIIPSCIITGLACEVETEHGLETIN